MIRLDESGNVRSLAEGRTSPVTVTSKENGGVGLYLSMTPETLSTLLELANSSGSPLEDVINKAFILYKASADAHREGKHIAILNPDWEVDQEIVGFEGVRSGHAVGS
jgi:hypothetical protein